MKKYVWGWVLLALFTGSQIASAAGPVHIKGTVQGIKPVSNDDQLDGALVVPTIRAVDLLQFNLENLLAPNETMSAGPTSANVPGNLYFPKQTETYFIFPITIKKESFSLYLNPGQTEELAGVTFRVPLGDLIDLSKANAPFTEMIPLIHLRSLAFGPERDWTTEKNITLTANQNFQKTASFNWARSAPGKQEADLIVSFQRTPANRWMISDLLGKPGASGTIASTDAQNASLKTLFVRITNGADRKPTVIRALVQPTQPGSTLQVGELPEPITGARVEAQAGQVTTIRWNPIASSGWMAVLRGSAALTPVPNFSILDLKTPHGPIVHALEWGFQGLLEPEATTNLEAWVSATTGEYALRSPGSLKESISLLFVGTEKDVPAPKAAGNDSQEPELFTYAKELRLVKIQ